MTQATAEIDTTTHPLLLFDGVCGMCNSFVDFIVARDRRHVFRFAPLQGETAAQIATPDDVEHLRSVVFVKNGQTFRKSSAVVRVLWELGGVWSMLGTLLWLIPKPLRDVGYRFVARIRYRIFGKKSACRLPTPEERSWFYP
ncbi:thiol-disulfide oxidoreductase DCC family protein [Rubinisphaera margarita]|uniref:thiol-disulfide oxidoreductase DCC family protein n=1 Tax=Rubinisphaera margarita TaxID=2909586 RepID=UPI0021BC57D6|nr:DCC1-like thiol-disulfide oxidoreductase family protein [Rubinisphaera margarita]